jgi:hypothetical protein
MVDFLDVVRFYLSVSPQFLSQSLFSQALKDHLTIPDERTRVLALLSRTMILTQVFPRRLELKSVKYDQRPIAEGGFGKVYRGLSDPTICVKVTTRVNDLGALTVRHKRFVVDLPNAEVEHVQAYTRELVLWAHAKHPNVLPFYGVFFNDSEQICLVSPYMAKGNLRDYATHLPQKARVPLVRHSYPPHLHTDVLTCHSSALRYHQWSRLFAWTRGRPHRSEGGAFEMRNYFYWLLVNLGSLRKTF